MPTKVGTQTSIGKTVDAVCSGRTASANRLHVDWIPAFAGMTKILQMRNCSTKAAFGGRLAEREQPGANKKESLRMANKHRGEIEAILDCRAYRLVLTLGALAELESAFGDDDMLALAARFETGRLSARDCVKIIAAGLRGAGCAVTDDEVALMRVNDGAAGYVDIVARLLNATFGGDDQQAGATTGREDGGETRAPFAGRA